MEIAQPPLTTCVSVSKEVFLEVHGELRVFQFVLIGSDPVAQVC